MVEIVAAGGTSRASRPEEGIQSVRETGMAVLPGAYSRDACERFREKADAVIERFIRDRAPLIHPECQFIPNYFRHDPDLMALVSHDWINLVLRVLIDEDYVLIHANMMNRRRRPDIQSDLPGFGNVWHSDSRYIGGQRLAGGFGYVVIVMLDDFTVENGATQYVPGSRDRRDIPEKEGHYAFKTIEGEAGTAVIMDSGIWHRSGPVSDLSRWGVFNLYGPWFMKPYFRYAEMIDPETARHLNPIHRRLFHFDSIPPLTESERLHTLVKKPAAGPYGPSNR